MDKITTSNGGLNDQEDGSDIVLVIIDSMRLHIEHDRITIDEAWDGLSNSNKRLIKESISASSESIVKHILKLDHVYIEATGDRLDAMNIASMIELKNWLVKSTSVAVTAIGLLLLYIYHEYESSGLHAFVGWVVTLFTG